jgi:hypothetical protein
MRGRKKSPSCSERGGQGLLYEILLWLGRGKGECYMTVWLGVRVTTQGDLERWLRGTKGKTSEATKKAPEITIQGL